MKALVGTAVVLLVIGLGTTAVGPEWVVDSVNGKVVVCHQKFHQERVRQVPVPVPAAGAPKTGSACPS